MSTNRDFSTQGALDFVQERILGEMSWGVLYGIYEEAHAQVQSMTDEECERFNDYQVLSYLSVILERVLTLFDES
jgi:hypothetical protein